MADDYVEPISGEEIIIDLCSQVAEHLRLDCNLRPSDAYSGGYMAKVSIHLEAYGMDVATVDAEIKSGKALPAPLGPEDTALTTTLDIPVEPALDQVRERSDQPVPTLAMEGGQPEIRQRRYVRRESVVGAATGERL